MLATTDKQDSLTESSQHSINLSLDRLHYELPGEMVGGIANAG